MKILNFKQFNETLVNDKSLEQLKKVRKLSKSTDIGDKVNIENDKLNNLIGDDNVLDKDVDTREDFDKDNKKRFKI